MARMTISRTILAGQFEEDAIDHLEAEIKKVINRTRGDNVTNRDVLLALTSVMDEVINMIKDDDSQRRVPLEE